MTSRTSGRPSADFDRSPLRWLILAAGVAAGGYAYQSRQPIATSDFLMMYRTAAAAPREMYAPATGRTNLNAPHFEVLIEPLTILSPETASAVWRALSVLALCGCVWWLARASDEKWSAADVGAVLLWAPFYHVLVLNQVTWIIWPLLVAAWWYWRQGRWTIGAIPFGIALSFKLFLAVFVIWLALRREWRAAAVVIISAGAAVAVGLLVYGPQVLLAWVRTLGAVEWAGMLNNASLRGFVTRAFSFNDAGTPPLMPLPALVVPLSVTGALAIVAVTCVRVRDRHVDDAWPALMAGALLASPLGWPYYAWWMLSGVKPSRLLVRSPLLWLPMAFVTRGQPSAWASVTIGSMFFWGLLAAWIGFICWPTRAAPPSRARRPPATELL